MDIDVFGEAIKAHYNGKPKVKIVVSSDKFEEDTIPVNYLFREYEDMPIVEQKALQLTKGKTLDVGAGAGSHSLFLQNTKNSIVTALDTSKGGIEICKERGLRHVVCENFFNHKKSYDSILMLMNGSGIIGSLSNINFFFQHLKNLLNKGGQLLIDSSDLIYLYENQDGEFWVNLNEGYYGEMRYSISYNNLKSEPFDWLYIDFNTLQKAANTNGFNCEMILEGEHYDYLARITIS